MATAASRSVAGKLHSEPPACERVVIPPVQRVFCVTGAVKLDECESVAAVASYDHVSNASEAVEEVFHLALPYVRWQVEYRNPWVGRC